MLEVRDGFLIRMIIIDPESSTNIDHRKVESFFFDMIIQGIGFAAKLLKGFQVCDLGANMEVDPDQFYMIHAG